MSTRVDAEELESTRSEKFLAVVLAAFLLVGAVWFYVKIDGWMQTPPEMTPAQHAVLAEAATAERELRTAQGEVRSARSELELAREDYEVALAAGEPAADLQAQYLARQTAYAEAQDELAEAREVAQQARSEERAVYRAHDERVAADRDELWVALVRLVFVVGWVLGSYRLILTLRRRESRYLPLSFAVAGTGAVLALIYAIDYITDYIDPFDLGPLVLSAIGVVATLVAFLLLQRYLAQRIPARRVRKGECPFCGYPVRGEGPHCEGCGREVVAECSTCARARRVGSSHCIACGAA